jgi:GNAT superfamily N-acetyltransferase
MNPVRLAPSHAAAYRNLMLEAYAQHPDAFTSSVQERAALPLSWWEARLSDASDASEIVFGSFVDGTLAGVAGLSFEHRDKTRHKATLFGMYVRDSCRGKGLGGQLVDEVLTCARTRAGVLLVQLTVTEGNLQLRAGHRRLLKSLCHTVLVQVEDRKGHTQVVMLDRLTQLGSVT